MELTRDTVATEAGAVPRDWHVLLVDDLVIETAPVCYGVVQVGKHVQGGVPIVPIKYVKEIDRAPLHRSSPAIEAQYTRSRVEAGDVLISVKGTIGRVGVVPGGFKGNISRELARLRVKPEHSSSYVAHQLEAPATQARIMASVVGTTRLEFSIATLRKFPVAVPPTRKEQEAIAEALSDADALIESLAQLIAKKRLIKQGAMQELLTGKRRLPGFEGEWKTTHLGELGHLLKGKGVRKDETTSGPLPCVRYGELYTHHEDIVRDFYSRISAEVAAGATALAPGDLLFAGSGETKAEIGKCAAFLGPEEAYAGGDIVIVRLVGADSPAFLGYYLNSWPVARQKASKGQGDAVVHISARALSEITICIPGDREQAAIARVLEAMDAELDALETKVEKARMIKQGMMHNLLTGKIRLV